MGGGAAVANGAGIFFVVDVVRCSVYDFDNLVLFWSNDVIQPCEFCVFTLWLIVDECALLLTV